MEAGEGESSVISGARDYNWPSPHIPRASRHALPTHFVRDLNITIS